MSDVSARLKEQVALGEMRWLNAVHDNGHGFEHTSDPDSTTLKRLNVNWALLIHIVEKEAGYGIVVSDQACP